MRPSSRLLVVIPGAGPGPSIGRDLMGGFGMEVGPALRYPPTRAALLGTISRRSGHEVRLWDERVEGPVGLPARADRAETDVLLEVSLPSRAADLALARRFLEAGMRVVLWGSLVRERPGDVLREAPGALGMVAEEEAVWSAFQRREGAPADPPPGMARWREDRLLRGAPVAAVADLGELPIPDRSLLRNEAYRLPDRAEPVATVSTSKGCPLDCAFCAYVRIEGRGMRYRALDHVMAEWRDIAARGIRRVVFRDPIFTIHRSRTLALLEAIESEGAPIRWQCETAVRCLDDELIRSMAAAGCEHVSLGIETASPRLQREYCGNKLPEPEGAGSIVRALKANQIQSRAFFMLGFPGETRQEMRATVELALHLDPESVQFCPATEYPGTAMTFGESARTPAGNGRNAVGGNGCLSAEEIDAEIRRAYRVFYLRPRKMWNELRHPGRLARRIVRARALGVVSR